MKYKGAYKRKRDLVLSESLIQGLILQFLAAEHILAFRMNTGIAKFDERFVAFGTKGMADILAFPSRFPVWIECKATKGRQSEFQKSFQALVEEHGHVYILARSLEDVKDGLGARMHLGGRNGHSSER